MADTLRYLDPVNDPYWRQQELGVEPPNPYTKYLVGAGIAALGIALARTPVGQRGFRVLSRFLHGSAQTELERLVIGRFYRARQLSEFLAAEGVASSRRAQVIGAHMKRLDDWIVERQINRARFDIGRLLGLRPLTVGDVLDNPKAFSFEAWYETSRYGGRSDPQRFMRALRELVDRNAEARRMQVSPGLYVNRFGDVIDLRGPGEWLHRALSGLEEIRVPIVGFQPLKIFRYSEIREARRQIPFHIYDVGSFQPILSELGENVAERRLRRPAVWIGENLYDLLDPDRGPLATGVYGLSFGTIPRIMATMLGIDPEQIATTKAARRRWLARVLDVGAQRQRSVWGQIRDFLGKRKDPYEPINLFNMAVRSVQEGRPGSAVAPWKLLIDQFRDEAMPLDAASFGRILAEIRRTQPGAKFLDDLFPKGLKFDTERDLAQALRRLAVTSKPGAKAVGTQVRDLYFRTYLRDPESFWKARHFKARRPFVIGSYDLISVSGEITQQERVTSLIQREILARAVEQNVIDLDRLLSLQLGGTQGKRLRQLLALNEMERAISTGSVRLESLSDAARNLIEQEARTLYPWYTVKSVEFSPTRELLRMSGGPVLIHRAFRPPSPIEILRAFNDAQRRQAVFKQTRDFLLQFTAGREDLEHFSTLTSLLYYTANRLNEMAARYGLGLSPASLGSAHQILSSLIFKRYVPALLGLGLGSYAAWEFENLTGIDLKTEFANTLAGFGLMAASFFEKTGITAAAKWAEDVLPGSELFWEMPVTSFFDARKTREEYEEFLREGRQPMRKGRWWQFSSTPYQGGRIQYFAPNWYQRMVSDYEWTPEGLGSKEEYFANAWFPTPRYPLAPLRYFVTDPYRWEREHYYTRPYPETGGFAIFEDIPLVGPALNQTIGRLFKPKRRMHEEELAAYIARRVQEAQETGEGSSVIVAPVGPGTGGALGVAIAADQNEAVRQEAAIQEQPVYTVQVTPAGMIRVYKGISPGTSIARAQNVAVRSGLKLRSQVRPYELAGLTYQESEPPVEEIVSTSDPVQAITAMQYQLSEMGGLYGWLMRSATPMGMAMERRRLRPRWQTPQMRATSIGRTFEDLNIGGFPGDLSELARRFIPNLPYYDEYREVNPIPNLMPSWMPGEDYFINFQQGDPYIKVPLGEARLPGGGFARLNREDVLRSWANAPMDLKQAILRGEVSPYEFYDVYTRFKILADVAPYSSQYRYYADLLTKNKELIPEGRYEEFQRIKREVSAVKERLRVFPYKFKDAQLIKEQVTIARILDNNTFLTLEYPDNPIRLAGIYVPSGRNDKLAQAAGFYIYSQLMPGTTVTIGYTADPLKKFSDDTLRTIRAVVWVDGVNLNRQLLELGYAREKDDDSPAGIHARYSPVEIAVGTLWERFAHMDTPIHCVAPWTEVITSDGVVAAGDLKPGAYVLTHTGHYKKVVDVRPQPAGKRVVEVKLSSSNIPLVVTDDHPILACRHVRKKRVTSRSRGVKLEPWDRNVIQRQHYEVANRVLELLVAGWNGTKEQMARELGVNRSYLARVMDMLAADGKIRRGNNRRALPVVVNPERYDTSPGPKLEFIHAGDLRPYDYVVYRPREMPESTPPLIDLAALNPDRFAVIGDEVTTTLHGGAPRTNGTKLPRFLPVTTELARLMGYYAAEGCIGNNASNYAQIVSFVFNRSETRYADDVANLLRRVFGKEPRVVVGDTTIRVELSLAFAAELLKHYVGEKEQKRVPEELLTTRDLRAEFIRGLLRGDGLKASRTVPYSELGMVALNILLWVRDALFHLWRIPAAIALGIVRNHPLYVLRIGSYPQLVEFVDGEGPCPNGPFERDVESRTSAAVGEFIFYRVESVSESEYQGGTIDIEVEGDDTFATLNADVHNTKFLQVRSPLEMYWREDLYGKRWRPWNLKDQIVPTLESWAAKPVWQAALYGAAYGALIFGATRWRRGGIIGGALFAGGLSFARWVYEQISGQVWVPARRRLEWDIWEYMDYLTYVKYKALYEATLREAEARGLEEVTWFFEQVEQRRRRTRWERQRLMEEKRRLTLEDKEGNRERIREINARLREISEDILTVEDPHPLLLQAIAYRQMYESTLYGADPYGDMTSIMRALPPNIRDYFMYFVEAGPEERELIRGRVPRGVERLLRARWGEEPGELPTPEEYFREHYLPPAHWEGWMPGKDLRDIKVQIVRHSGIDPTELGVWDSDVRTAEEHQAPLLPWNQPNTEIDLQEQLRLLLEGEGLRDVIVRVERSRNLGITVGFDVEVDRQAEIDMAILHELENILR